MTVPDMLDMGGGAGKPLQKGASSSASSPSIRMRKEVGLLEGVAIICGIIIGSGIFISPKGVFQDAKSVGLTILIWVSTGLLSMIGAVCYAELGTTLQRSGGDYAYIHEAFGAFPAFLFLWDANVVFVPTTNAIMGLTFAKYVIQPFFPAGCVPDAGVRLIAACAIIFLSFLNCYDVRITTRMQNVFLIAKVGGLTTVIIAGLVHLFQGHTENFHDAWAGTQTDPSLIAVSFYSGIFSYAGWNYLNFMTEELKEPYKNLPRAIYISLPLCTGIYVLANIGYIAVLNYQQMMDSDAIAVTFGGRVLGGMAWVMPVFVALSTFGGLSVHIMTSSRLLFVGARQGQMPSALSTISKTRLTPAPALAFLCLLSLCYLFTSDIFALIEYSSFVESSFIFVTISGMVFLRIRRPDLPRPIRFPLAVPLLFLLLCAFLVVLPVFQRPMEVGMGVLITLTGIPFYLLCLRWKPQFLRELGKESTLLVQKLFVSVKED